MKLLNESAPATTVHAKENRESLPDFRNVSIRLFQPNKERVQENGSKMMHAQLPDNTPKALRGQIRKYNLNESHFAGVILAEVWYLCTEIYVLLKLLTFCYCVYVVLMRVYCDNNKQAQCKGWPPLYSGRQLFIDTSIYCTFFLLDMWFRKQIRICTYR